MSDGGRDRESLAAGGLGFAKHNPAKLHGMLPCAYGPPTGDRIHPKAINAPAHVHELTFSCNHRFQFLKGRKGVRNQISIWCAREPIAARISLSRKWPPES